MRLLVAFLAVGLLGAGFTRVRVEPAMVHVRWTVHHRDLTATAEMDVPAARDSEANAELFPAPAYRVPEPAHQRLRIVVAGRTLFDRALTRDEVRRLGNVRTLHVSNVRGAGERDLTADGTAVLRYSAAPPGYRVAPAPAASESHEASRPSDCDYKGSFELERVASYAGTTARIVQRGNAFNCVDARANTATLEITSGGRTDYTSRVSMTDHEKLWSPPQAAGALRILDGPAFVDFEGTGAPSVVLTGSTGGMHCCYRMHVFYRKAPHAYGEAIRDWGNGDSYPVPLRDARSGEVLLGSSNDAFAGLYGYGNAVEPVQIFAFERGRFLDVTLGFPAVVREQADAIWQRTRAELRAKKTWAAQPGMVAYLADMSELGREAEAWRNVRSACAARDCPNYLHDVRDALRWLSSRPDAGRARR